MFAELESQIVATLQSVFDRFGWFGVAGIMAFENATSITPSEVILGLAGWMLIAAHDASPAMIFIGGLYAACGSAVGASIPYWIARIGGRPVVDHAARWLHLDLGYITRAESQFQRWGTGLVFFGRVLPGIRVLVSIPAGLARMPFLRFVAFTTVGAYVWCTLLIGVGYTIGHEWQLISMIVRQFAPWLLAALAVLVFCGWMARRLILRRLRPTPVQVAVGEGKPNRELSAFCTNDLFEKEGK